MNAKEHNISELEAMLTGRIKKNMRRLKGWLKQNSITCYRIYNRDIPQIPVIADIYEGRLHCSLYKNKMKLLQNRLLKL